MRIIEGDFSNPQVIELLHTHLTTARSHTAPGSVHALDLNGLRSPDISFWTIWDDETLLGCGALSRLASDHGEIKSMHTAQAMRGKGVGTAMLRHIIGAARARGMSRLSLETGSWEYFLPAREFYKRHGFLECPPFGEYVPDPNSIFMSLDLRESLSRGAERTRPKFTPTNGYARKSALQGEMQKADPSPPSLQPAGFPPQNAPGTFCSPRVRDHSDNRPRAAGAA